MEEQSNDNKSFWGKAKDGIMNLIHKVHKNNVEKEECKEKEGAQKRIKRIALIMLVASFVVAVPVNLAGEAIENYTHATEKFEDVSNFLLEELPDIVKVVSEEVLGVEDGAYTLKQVDNIGRITLDVIKMKFGDSITPEQIQSLLSLKGIKLDDSLPDKFVLKCTHNSGLGMAICKDKSTLDIASVKKELRKGLKQNYFATQREWPYKNVKPRIIAEKFMVDGENECLTDYKFFCFGGEPKFMYRSMDKAKDPRTDFFDMDYNRLNMRMRDPNSDSIPQKPENFEKMKELSRILSAGIPHLRVDFYEIGGKIYFGELTFYHCGGFAKIYPEEWMITLGDWINISKDTL